MGTGTCDVPFLRTQEGCRGVQAIAARRAVRADSRAEQVGHIARGLPWQPEVSNGIRHDLVVEAIHLVLILDR